MAVENKSVLNLGQLGLCAVADKDVEHGVLACRTPDLINRVVNEQEDHYVSGTLRVKGSTLSIDLRPSISLSQRGARTRQVIY